MTDTDTDTDTDTVLKTAQEHIKLAIKDFGRLPYSAAIAIDEAVKCLKLARKQLDIVD